MINENRQIKIGALLSYLGVFFSIITGLIYNPWMIKTIGNSDYALYTLAMSLANTFLIDFGLSMASQRYVSNYVAQNDQKSANNIIGLVFKLYIIITVILLVIFTVMFFFLEKIYAQLSPAELQKFKILYIMVVIYSVTSFPFITLKGILSAYQKFIPLKVCDLLYRFLSISLTFVALFIGQGVYILVVVNLFSSLLVTALRIIFIKKTTPVHANFSYKEKNKAKELLNFSIWTSVSSVVTRLLLSLAPSVLGIVSGSLEIATFGYAVSIEGFIYSFVNAINGFFMPKLSKISAQPVATEEKQQKILDLMTHVGRFILALFGLIFVGFLVLGKQFVFMLVGSEYASSYYCVLLICGYGIIAYPQQIANTYTLVVDKVKKRGVISLIAMGVYFATVFIFAKLWGSVGVALSVFVALSLQTVLMNILYHRDLKINIALFFKRCHLRFLPGFLVFAVFAWLISKLSLSGWYGFAIKVVLIVFTYLIIAFIAFLGKEDRRKLFSMIKLKNKRKN